VKADEPALRPRRRHPPHRDHVRERGGRPSRVRDSTRPTGATGRPGDRVQGDGKVAPHPDEVRQD
jgi:hypothetical protein